MHPLHHLYNLCVTTGRTNPLMIARIYGMVFQRIMEHDVTADEVCFHVRCRHVVAVSLTVCL